MITSTHAVLICSKVQVYQNNWKGIMSSPQSNPVDHLWAKAACMNTVSLCSPPCRENIPKYWEYGLWQTPWPETLLAQSCFYCCLYLAYYWTRYYLQILVILEQQLVRVRGERGRDAMFAPFLPSLLTPYWELWVCEGWFWLSANNVTWDCIKSPTKNQILT